MAIVRLSAADIIVEIRRIIGEATASLSHVTDAELVRVINHYGQKLSSHLGQIVGKPRVFPEMWRTVANSTTTAAVGNLVVTAGSATVTFPDDYDMWISFYDLDMNRPIDIVSSVSRWQWNSLREKAAGPIEAIELRGVVAASNRVTATLWPPTASGVTPSFEMVYYRYPAALPNATPATEYPDADIKYQWLWVYGPALVLLAPGDPSFTRYQALEKELLVDLLSSARQDGQGAL